MWPFLTAALSAIPAAATSGTAFAAYALALGAYALSVWRVSRNKNLLDKLHKLPPKDRLKALELEIGGVRLRSGISPEQWVRSRVHKYYLVAFLATCVVMIAVATLATAYGIWTVRTIEVVNADFGQSNNGQSLSSADLQHLTAVIEAAMNRNVARASAAFDQLSPPARAAYERASPTAAGGLFRTEELTTARAAPSQTSTPVPARADAPPAADVAEIEPNDDFIHAQAIALSATISGSIASPSDVDYFKFTTPEPRRIMIEVALGNESKTLTPQLRVFGPKKDALSSPVANTTAGGDVSYLFAALPNTLYFVEVTSAYSNAGSYKLTVRPKDVRDRAFEPNDDTFHATPIKVNMTVEAEIMDPGDTDYYVFNSGNAAKLVVALENRSSTLTPTITLLNSDKDKMGTESKTTAGSNASYRFAPQPNSSYYIAISPTYSNSGQYDLTVRPE